MKLLKLVAFSCLVNTYAFGQVLTLEKYLENTQKNNDGYSSFQKRKSAFKNAESEAELLYTSRFEMETKYVDDQKPTTTVDFQGNQTKLNTSKVGVSKSTRFGSNFAVSYNISNTKINGASSDLVPENEFFENYAKIEFSQSLWRNAFGTEIQAQEKMMRLRAKSNELNQDYQAKLVLLDAENIYYQLLIASESLEIQKKSYKRSKSIEHWTRKRLAKKLADRADYLQARSATKQRELDLQIAKDEFRKISQLFNSVQGVQSVDLKQEIDPRELKKISDFKFAAKNKMRLDTRAIELGVQSEIENNKMNLESIKPDLKLIGSASFYGRDSEMDSSIDGSLSNDNPVYAVGISFTMPLDFSSVKKSKKSYKTSQEAARHELKRRQFEDDYNWQNLKNQYQETKRQLLIMNELVQAQKEKLDNERKIQKRGLSTTFQVLSFEQEYLASQMRRVQLKSNLAKVYTDLMLFI